MSMLQYDKIIIGAGLYGLYAALQCGRRGESALILECDAGPFTRATYVNQARVHMGYHYPRSIATAIKTREFFDRFNDDFGFCINNDFTSIYATSSRLSWTNAAQFVKFCNNTGIFCQSVPADTYFKSGMCDGAFLTTEYTYDARLLGDWFIAGLSKLPGVNIIYNAKITKIEREGDLYTVTLSNNKQFKTGYILNATYAGINQIHTFLGFPELQIKYELCEIILCRAGKSLKNTGITVMDGPFFSIMPFGRTGLHSLTSVAFTPHSVSYDSVPVFECQSLSDGICSRQRLGNCNNCPSKPDSAWEYMSHLAMKYLTDDYGFEYVESLYSIKPILKASEVDDSRPTLIRRYSDTPRFVSVLSGKITTVYELDEELEL